MKSISKILLKYGLIRCSFIFLFFLIACKSEFNSENSTSSSSSSGDYLPLSGGTLTGSLIVPPNGFKVGTNQLVATAGKIGIGTLAPTTTLTVAGTATFLNAIDVGGATTLSTLDTISNTNVGGDLSVAGNLILSGTLATSGATNLLSTLDVVGASTLSDVNILDDLSLSGLLNCTACVKATNILSDGVNTILATTQGGTVEWQSPKLQYGLKFEYVDPSNIRLVPSGLGSRASVLLSNGTDLKSVILSSNLIGNLASTGAGGLDTGAEAANTGYDVYLITLPDLTFPALLYTISGAAPTMPVGYTYISEVLWFVSNSQGGGNSDIARFVDVGDGVCQYIVSNGIKVLNDGEQTAVTAVNLASAVPALASIATVFVNPTNMDALTLTNLRLYYDAAGAIQFANISNLINSLLVGAATNKSAYFDLPLHNGLANSLFYSFSNLPLIGAFGVDMYVQKWKLASRMSR